MINDDTIKLLRECNAGVKMGVSALDEVIEHVSNKEFKQILLSCKKTHEDLGNETGDILNKYNNEGKKPNPIAKSMSWIKTNVKLSLNDSDPTIADLITDGCNMGVKSLNRYLNQYKAAEESIKELTRKLINSEKKLVDNIAKFL